MNREATRCVLPFRFPNAGNFFRAFPCLCASRPSLLPLGLMLAHVALLFFAAFPLSGTAVFQPSQPDVLGCITPAAACSPKEPGHLSVDRSERVLAYLELSEKKEIDPWLRDDIRIAWITVLYAASDNPQPHVDANYRVLGCHPSDVWPRIVARREAMLGGEYSNFFDGAVSPRKPAASVSLDSATQALEKTNGARAMNSRAA